MANGKVERRAVLTVDLDCVECRGRGSVPRVLTVGFGPSAHNVHVTSPCRCLQSIALPDGALKEG